MSEETKTPASDGWLSPAQLAAAPPKHKGAPRAERSLLGRAAFWRKPTVDDDSWLSAEELIAAKDENRVILRSVQQSRWKRFWSKRYLGAFSLHHLLILTAICGILAVPVFQPQLLIKGVAPTMPNKNALLMGPASGIHEVRIELADLAGENKLTKAQIFQLRRNIAARHPELLKTNYVPADAVFRRIDDSRNWFGTLGFYYYGKGPRAFEGPPAEGRSIANPFMLVVPEFWGLSIWGAGNLNWRKNTIPAEELAKPDFPLYPRPLNLVYRPHDARIEVDYDITGYIDAVNKWIVTELSPAQATFGITAYNARDFGMRFIQLDLDESVNIENDEQPDRPRFIGDQLTFYNVLCGPEGGCNHRNNPPVYFSSIEVKELPASAVFYLWNKRPKDTKKPDVRYVINLK